MRATPTDVRELDVIGQEVHRLTIVDKYQRPELRADLRLRLLVRCRCGYTFEAAAVNVLRGRTSMCAACRAHYHLRWGEEPPVVPATIEDLTQPVEQDPADQLQAEADRLREVLGL